MSARMIAGCATAMTGFCMYSHARMARGRQRPGFPSPSTLPALPKLGSQEARILDKLDSAAGKNSRGSNGTIKAHRPGRP